MTGQVTAGTAGSGYRTEPQDHLYESDVPDWGRRPHCCRCGRTREQHAIPRPRRAT